MSRMRGFTVIEVMVIVVIISLLAGIALAIDNQLIDKGNSVTVASHAKAISRLLENYYSSHGGKYPSTDQVGTSSSVQTNLLDGADAAIFNGAKGTYAFLPIPSYYGATRPADSAYSAYWEDSYVYQPLQTDNTLCEASNQQCVRYVLYYSDSPTVREMLTIESIHQQ